MVSEANNLACSTKMQEKIMNQSEIIQNITNPMSDTDPRVIAAFAAVLTPDENDDFPSDVMNALQESDWRALLKIAFSSPLNYQQSREFLDTLIYTKTQIDVITFLNKTIKSPEQLIHAEFRGLFAKESGKVSAIIMNRARGREF
jgi:dephospho-CoA kinase